MNKEKCEHALVELERLYYDLDGSFGAMKSFKKNIELLYRLLNEHFDNPLLNYKEITEGDVIWDNKEK